jgi:hypothetical protein
MYDQGRRRLERRRKRNLVANGQAAEAEPYRGVHMLREKGEMHTGGVEQNHGISGENPGSNLRWRCSARVPQNIELSALQIS